MTINLNNRTETFNFDEMTIAEIINEKNFTFQALVVKINGQLVKKPQYSEAKVIEGDKVEIIHLISGG